MPPVWNQRTPRVPNRWSQSTASAASWLAALWPRSETPACAAHSEAPLGEVQPVADGAADAVIGHELHQRSVHPSLQDEVLDEPADVVVGQCGDNGGPQAEAAPQPAGDVVFPASLPCGNRPGIADAALAWVQAEHHLAQGYQVITSVCVRADGQVGHHEA